MVELGGDMGCQAEVEADDHLKQAVNAVGLQEEAIVARSAAAAAAADNSCCNTLLHSSDSLHRLHMDPVHHNTAHTG